MQAWADASGLPAPPVAALARCRGLLASGNEAVRYFEDALRVDDQDTRPIERARIQLLLGETLRRSRQRTQVLRSDAMVRETAQASSGGLKPRTVRPHKETRVRRAAIWAMVYTGWPGFVTSCP
jgi:hypothetical protein